MQAPSCIAPPLPQNSPRGHDPQHDPDTVAERTRALAHHCLPASAFFVQRWIARASDECVWRARERAATCARREVIEAPRRGIVRATMSKLGAAHDAVLAKFRERQLKASQIQLDAEKEREARLAKHKASKRACRCERLDSAGGRVRRHATLCGR